MSDKVDQIVLRMYRIGTGDCFTLKFMKAGTVSFTMMIDCGSCKGDSAYFTRFVNLINTKDINGKIDVLVISHEHLDHIIGFSRAQAEFKKITIGQVWIGWTEDPTNVLAHTLKTKYGKDVAALNTAINRINALIGDPQYAAKFAGEFGATDLMATKKSFAGSLQESLELYPQQQLAGKTEMGRAMDYVLEEISKNSGQPPFYCKPGMPVPELPGTEGIRFYVLGPPEDESALKTELVKDDVYDRKAAFSSNPGFGAALEFGPAQEIDQDCLPFSDAFALNSGEKDQSYQELFGKPENNWRNIDCDWLHYAGSLAIRLEKYINNTSLVLAIEFIDSGRVLLFPGDAQSGNWESWHDPNLKWTIKKDGQEIVVTAKDLLARTVFYKVGHHLSHNGTASRSGLDLMQSPDLMALATLDYGHINTIWKRTMPSPGVLTTLICKAKGRVFRIDEGLLTTSEAIDERNKLSRAEKAAFEKNHNVTTDYIELIFNG